MCISENDIYSICCIIVQSTVVDLHFTVSGGGSIIPEAGVISGGVCTGLSALSTGAHLELEVINPL